MLMASGMTRINLIDPKILTDQHLNAERVESTMALASARRSLQSRNGLRSSNVFTLNAGHVIFFHKRLGYLKRRFFELSEEMKRRGMNPQSPWPDDSWARADMWEDYTPTEADCNIIKARIRDRLLLKPSWYKYMGQSVVDLTWIENHYGSNN